MARGDIEIGTTDSIRNEFDFARKAVSWSDREQSPGVEPKDLDAVTSQDVLIKTDVDASDIGVAVDEGVVTLRGNVASYTEKSPRNGWHCGCMV